MEGDNTATRYGIVAAGVMAVAAYAVVALSAQTAAITGDFSQAAVAEVRDAQGQVVLRGEFAPSTEEDDDTEREAKLEPTGQDADASGEAELDVSKCDPAEQEIEFSIRGVRPGSTFTFAIDGKDVATATADRRGRAEVEFDVKASSSRPNQR